MTDTIKGSIIGALIAGVFSIIIFIAGNFSTQATIEKETVNTLSNYFDSVTKNMAYEQALKTIYQESLDANEKIDNLSKENRSLSEKNENLKKQFTAELGSVPVISYNDVELIINGDKVNINKIDSMALINDNKYFSESIINGILQDDLTFEVQDNVIYIGNKKYQRINLLNQYKPYEVFGYSEFLPNSNASFSMSGQTWSNGFTLKADWSSDAYVIFNLQERYSQMTLSIGHVDGTPMRDSKLIIYLDGEKSEEFDLLAEELVTERIIHINGAKQLKMYILALGNNNPTYGFANIKIE